MKLIESCRVFNWNVNCNHRRMIYLNCKKISLDRVNMCSIHFSQQNMFNTVKILQPFKPFACNLFIKYIELAGKEAGKEVDHMFRATIASILG